MHSPLHAPLLLELIKERRSTRHYSRRPVSRDLVEHLCEAARWAPSNWNGQPWQLIAIDDPATLASVYALLMDRVAEVERGAGADLRLVRFVGHCRRYFDVIRDSPVLLAACYKPSGQVFEQALAEYFDDPLSVAAWNPNLLSLGMAVQNLLLCAHEAGLGACFHSGPVAFLRGPLQRLLGLPPRLELAGFVTLGWPAAGALPREVHRKPRDHVRRWVTRGAQ